MSSSSFSTSGKPIAIIQGVGLPGGTGASVAEKFAKQYPVVLLSRTSASFRDVAASINSSGGQALGIETDVSDPKSMSETFEKIKALGGDGGKVTVAAAVMNGLTFFSKKPFLELTLEDFEGPYQGTGRGTFLFAQNVLPLLLEHGKVNSTEAHPPTLIFTGATASVKGSAQFGAFAAGKWAVRALSQSLAREFGPQGVHVAHAVIDGVIDGPRASRYNIEKDKKIDPVAIADAYWHLHTQPKTSFTYEIDIRPSVEKW